MNPYFFDYTSYEVNVWYLMHMIGVLVCSVLALILKTKRVPLTYRDIIIGIPFIAAFGFFGARVYYAVLHSVVLRENTSFMEAFRHGGWGFLGSFIFALIFLFLFTKLRIKRVSFLEVADYVFPFVILEQAFGRIGCFFAGCCYGGATDLPWGCVFPIVDNVKRHPTQIYYVFLVLVTFFSARFIYKKYPINGITLFYTILAYGFLRFFGEFFRVDSPTVFGFLTLAQTKMLVITAIGLIGIIINSLNRDTFHLTVSKKEQK